MQLQILSNQEQWPPNGVGFRNPPDLELFHIDFASLIDAMFSFLISSFALQFWKLKALYTFSVAVMTKIYLKFPSRFWDTNPGMKWWLYADERRGYFPVWEVVLDSHYTFSLLKYGT